MSRHSVLVAILAMGSLLTVSSASAVTPQLDFSVALSPYTGGTATAPAMLTLHTTTTPKMNEPAFAADHLRFDLDPSIVTAFQPPAAACSDAQVMLTPRRARRLVTAR